LRWRKPRSVGLGRIERVPVDPETVAAGLPRALRDFLQHGAAEPEHHIATVGFIRYNGVDHLMATGGAEAVASALHELISLVQHVLDDEGVTFLATDIDQDGGKIIMVAGVPGVQEDDEGRLLRAARRVVDEAHQIPLDVKIGVDHGHVFVCEIGTIFRATYTIMGDTVNLAARLMAASSAGEVYAGPAALDASLTLFETTALEPFAVKGKARPVHAYAVGDARGSRPSQHGGELPFVGRADEQARLGRLVNDLFAGTGNAVAVIGERGVGKTRLVDEILASLDEGLHVDIRVEPYERSTPYRPLRDPVRDLLGIDRADPEAMAAQLRRHVERLSPEALPFLPVIGDVTMIPVPSTAEVDRIDPRFRQARTADVLVDLLSKTFDGPVFFQVEDGHYMDEASAHAMRRIADATADQPWLVLTTRRDVSGGFDPGGQEIRLGPLSDDEARELVHRATEAAPLRPHDVDAIVERAGGLPLFLEEIVRAVRTVGGVQSLPDSLEAVVSAQIDELHPLTRRLLRFSSVLGRSFRVTIFNELVAPENILLDAATRRDLAGFLEDDGPGRVRFRHAMIRDVAYSGLSFQRRRELHLRAGEAAEQASGANPEGASDVLALHFALANDHVRSWKYALIAGDRAATAYANVEAAAHYERALGSVRRLREVDDRERAAVWTALGDVRERAGLFEGALDAYRRATHFAVDDRVLHGDLMLRRALVRRRSGAYQAALRELTVGAKMFAADRSTLGVRTLGRLEAERSAVRREQQRPREALRHAEEAERHARHVSDLETLGRALDLIHWAHRITGRTEHEAPYVEIIAIYEEIGDLSSVAQMWNNRGADAFYAGHWPEAIDAYTKSSEAARRAGNDVQAAISDTNVVELFINQGRLDEAEPLMKETLRVLWASNRAPAATFAESELARLLLRRRDHGQAEELLLRIRDRSEAAGEALNVLNATVLLAEVKLEQGRVEEALVLLGEALADAGELAELFGPTIARLRARGLAALGQVDEALSHLDPALVHARRQGRIYDVALLLEAKSEICVRAGRDPDAQETTEASRLFDQLDVRREPGPDR
jgi:class 3 adenylate cyclase/tetratricopeptide (TPR) repeat protein